METGLCLIFLVPIFAGMFAIGMALVKAIQVSAVCRNANVMVVRNINMADPNNQKLVVRTAQGLRMGLPDSSPDPGGKGLIVLSKIIRVGANECAQVNDVSGNPLTPANCPNYGYYVFASRILIGNSSLFTSPLGSPSSSADSNGDISVANYVTVPANRASGFPPSTYDPPANTMPARNGLIYLSRGGFSYVSEAIFDVSDVAMFPWIPPHIYSRNVS